MNDWFHAVFLILFQVLSGRRDGRIRFLKLQVQIYQRKIPGNRLVLNQIERNKLLELGAELGHEVRDLLEIADFKTYQRWLRQQKAAIFLAGDPSQTHLSIQFLDPALPRVIENEQYGPLWSFGIAMDKGLPCLALLAPVPAGGKASRGMFDAATRTVRVTGAGFEHRIQLPPPGTSQTPTIV